MILPVTRRGGLISQNAQVRRILLCSIHVVVSAKVSMSILLQKAAFMRHRSDSATMSNEPDTASTAMAPRAQGSSRFATRSLRSPVANAPSTLKSNRNADAIATATASM
jgi:hypothetical protein